MIIYIHGFGGSGEGSKAKVFRDYFHSIGEDFIAPSLNNVPELAIGTLEELIRSYHGEVYLIGSSLGGYYATYLSQMEEVKKVVLINTATKPYETLNRALGEAPNFYDSSYFQWSDKHIEMLKSYESDSLHMYLRKNDFLVMLQKGDELLDYKDAASKYDGCQMLVEDGGSHSFDGIEHHFETMREFFAIGEHFKHTATVKGVGLPNDVLAERIGDLYYDDLAQFLKHFAKKLSMDALSDESRGRIKLANSLDKASKAISEAGGYIEKSWEICAISTIRWMEKNGYNKTPTISFKKDIPKKITNKLYNFSFKDIRFLYDTKNILPLRLEYNYLLDKNGIFNGSDEGTYLKKHYESLGFKVFENDIKPYMQPSYPDDDRNYLRFYYLKRFIAAKGDIVFYYDIEGILDDEDHSFLVFNYDESAKKLIERDFG